MTSEAITTRSSQSRRDPQTDQATPNAGPGLVRRLAPYVLALVLLVVIMLTRPDFELVRYGKAVAYAVAILGLTVVMGFSGQFSLAQAAFAGIGAYTTAILVADHGWPVLATVPLAGLLGLLAGTIVGIPALRIRGHYLTTMSLALAIVFPTVVKRYDSLTGGPDGKVAISDFSAPFGLDLTVTQWKFAVVVLVALVCYAFVDNVMRSRVGRALLVVRDNEIGAVSNGIFASGYRVVSFGVSGLFGAVGGSLLVMMLEVAGPDDYGLLLTILLVTGLIVGGATSLIGAVIGGLVIAFLPDLTSGWASGGAGGNLLYAALLILAMFFLPRGLASIASRARSWWTTRRQSAST